MSTFVKSELSKKNPYYLQRERYLELKHFCLQYPTWKKASIGLDGLSKRPADLEMLSKTNNLSDPTAKCAEARDYYIRRMQIVEDAAIATDEFFADYILKAVTEGYSYENLRTVHNIPCYRDYYYQMYRKFFWILSKLRD